MLFRELALLTPTASAFVRVGVFEPMFALTGHCQQTADSVEKLASKVSRLVTPKILPATVRFGGPCGLEFASNRTLVVVVQLAFSACLQSY